MRVRITGTEVLNYEELEVVAVQGQLAAVASLVLFTVAVCFALRSLRVLLALVASLVASLVWTNAFAAAAIGQLNQVSVAFNVLIVGLGGELGIHFCLRYEELAAEGSSRAEALALAGATIGSSLLSSAGTTAIGFLVFLPTDYRGVAELGLISGAGVLLSLVSTLTLLPALLSLGAPAEPEFRAARPSRIARLAPPAGGARARGPLDRPRRRARLARAAAARALRPQSGQPARPQHRIGAGVPRPARAERDLALDDRRDRARPRERRRRRRRSWLRFRPSTAPSRSPTSCPSTRTRSASSSRRWRSSFRSGRRPRRTPIPRSSSTRSSGSTGALAPAKARARGGSGPGGERGASAEALGRLLAAVRAAPDPAPLLAQLDRNLVASLPEQLDDLRIALHPERRDARDAPARAARPDARRERTRADPGLPEEGPRGQREPRRVHGRRDGGRARTTGPAVGLVEWGRVTSGAMQQAMAVGFVATLLFLFLLWRNLWDTLLAFFPLLLAALVTCAGDGARSACPSTSPT